jgi:hypothetical protein
LFFLFPNNTAFDVAAWIGVGVSILAVAGIADQYSTGLSMLLWATLWALYLSFVNVGQTFYGFGWESILLEAGFFAMFLGSRSAHPSPMVIWMFRWLLFRVMFGAGLIKLRGDSCWRDLTCLNYHYETQPMPNPLSWFFHWAPQWTHSGGVLFNHFAELIVPFAYFLPQPIASIAGMVTIVFQLTIFLSGNLSWLNFLTMVLAFSVIDGRFLVKVLPLHAPQLHAPGMVYRVAIVALAAMVAYLSIPPILNMISSNQVMNTAYNRFHLVGSYGAFGSITRLRYEVVVEGTEETVLTPSTKWREYEFRGKPGNPSSIPAQIAPYHLRLDWLMWFAAMGSYDQYPWFVNFVAKLLQNDPPVLGLLKANPFPENPPRFVRAQLYEYRFTTPAEHSHTGLWWNREFIQEYFPPASLDNPGFRRVLEQQGWLEREHSH